MKTSLNLSTAAAKISRFRMAGLFNLILAVMFLVAGVTTAHAQKTWTVSPGALQNRAGAGGTIQVTLGGVTYTASTGAAQGNTANLQNLFTNGSLTSPSGNTIKFDPAQVSIVNGEVQITSNVINGIASPDGLTLDVVPNPPPPPPPPVVPLVQVSGSLELGGSLAGVNSTGGDAEYNFELGYGDATGTTTSLAHVDLKYTDLTDKTIGGLLTEIDFDLETQLPSALQSDLTLDSADNALYFAFPTSIENPTVEGYSTDASLSYSTDLAVPEGGASLMYLLLAGVSCCGAMFFSSRNRFGKRESD
jgi:hypothetical protein